jgi:hypothetical protein
MNYLLVAAGTALLIVLLEFGTIAPCGIVRAEVRQQAAREGVFAAGLAAALPDGVIDSLIAAQYGPLSPGRCIALAFAGAPLNAAPSVQPSASAVTTPQNTAAAIKLASTGTQVTMLECKKKRLSGELKTYVASAEC